MAFNFKVVWWKGATNQAPDTLSRNPVGSSSPEEMLAANDESNNQEPLAAEVRAIHKDGLESTWLQELCKVAEEDNEYQQLKEYVINRFPNHLHLL